MFGSSPRIPIHPLVVLGGTAVDVDVSDGAQDLSLALSRQKTSRDKTTRVQRSTSSKMKRVTPDSSCSQYSYPVEAGTIALRRTKLSRRFHSLRTLFNSPKKRLQLDQLWPLLGCLRIRLTTTRYYYFPMHKSIASSGEFVRAEWDLSRIFRVRRIEQKEFLWVAFRVSRNARQP